ncbi:exodeoxyribonuclease VII large subunit [Chlamydiifrater phoenicopteri]|uniref:exodeoxyribonuclease VII large subunit n=1 Tax=Chlamydiifrater phoenicopteri TaxID=2681469 RepID=UPI001BCE7C96|nr:exodeoxyribonuclease VII large subunit [Chlamydiifrater phoenicopteri]
MFPEPITVSSLTEQLKSLLQKNFTFLAIKGELANVTLQASGHLYFSIKDANALLNGAFFNFRSKYSGPVLKNGDAVVVYGKLSIYAPRGSYQIVASAIVSSGLGDLLLRFEETKKKLAAQGYFDSKHKKPLPAKVKRIGVISSPTGAVIQDIINVLKRRCRDFQLILYPVKVQGEGSAEEVATAVKQFNEIVLPDVIIIARGGGSFEDLQAFNEEIVVKAIYESSLPIISAVGHEVDFTLCDMAADVRAPTPSAAAEIVCRSSESMEQWLQGFRSYLLSHARNFLSSYRNTFFQWEKMLDHADFYREAYQRLDFASMSLQRSSSERCREARTNLQNIQRSLSIPVHNKIHYYQSRLLLFQNTLSTQTITTSRARIELLHQQLNKSIQDKASLFHLQRRRLDKMLTQSLSYHLNRTEESWRRMKNFSISLQSATKHIFEINRHRIAKVHDQIIVAMNEKLNRLKNRREVCLESLKALNPKNVLNRGYSMLFDFNKDSAIISAETLQPGLAVKAVLHDGEKTLVVSNQEELSKAL